MIAHAGPWKIVTISKRALATSSKAQTPKTVQRRLGLTRVNIVSSKLCDDVLQRLSSSLKRHEHCDIIDIHPGTGLWSSKLHNHIKPRSHTLIEADQESYLPHLKPLLDQPNSRYRLAPVPGNDAGWAGYERIFQEDFLPHQKKLDLTDPAFVNNSLLLVANMAYRSRKTGPGIGTSPTQWLIHRFFNTIKEHSSFHSYGLVRLLIWVLDEEKATLIPRTIGARGKIAVQAEMLSSSEEVAGTDRGGGRQCRETSLELESARNVAMFTRDHQLKIPDDRKGALHRQVTGEAGKDKLNGKAEPIVPDTRESRGLRKWHMELQILEKRFMEGAFTEFVGELPVDPQERIPSIGKRVRKTGRGLKERSRTPEWLRMRRLQSNLKSQQKKQVAMMELSDRQADIENYQKRLENPGLSEEDRALTQKRLDEAVQRSKAQLDDASKSIAEKLAFYSDDRMALQEVPPILMWDRRTIEPLIVRESEFSPEHALALLDIQPKPSETNEYFDLILGSLFQSQTQTIGEGLNSLAPGAAETLIPEVPALRSRINPESMRVRALTTEMLQGLAEAWSKWPFRPSMAQLISEHRDNTSADIASTE